VACSATAADDRLRSPVLSGLSFAVIDVGDPSTRALFVIDSGSDLPSPVAADSIPAPVADAQQAI